jgi:hypothetical protein
MKGTAMKRTVKKMKLNRETLLQLVPDQLGAVGGYSDFCYPPTFAPTCYNGCATASCPDICS